MEEENLNKGNIEDIREEVLKKMREDDRISKIIEELEISSVIDDLINKVEQNVGWNFSEDDRNKTRIFIVTHFTSDKFLKTVIKGAIKDK